MKLMSNVLTWFGRKLTESEDLALWERTRWLRDHKASLVGDPDEKLSGREPIQVRTAA
ncbi:hypothetical protein [Parvularcula dongshanensis]|uniref:Uncharacterized protein n=1 Tax=Parvularcula dongshanensis TaxID=1173995 RepID=A0A840I738_9PROT|nr:hypothetical protein [Parvularcula dongshanensis]MBB4660312.1 hypothetical protein [Parvularcula dongshanensis]